MMAGGNIPLDLIIYAGIAIFLVVRLVSILGKRMGNEDSNIDNNPLFRQTRKGDKEQSHGSFKTDHTGDDDELLDASAHDYQPQRAIFDKLPPHIQDGLKQIAAKDHDFETADFIEGAKMAYEMIFDALAAGDLKALKPLVTKDVYADFEAAIQERQDKGWQCLDRLATNPTATITDAKLEGQNAYIQVEFHTEQYNEIQDAEGQLLEGSPTVPNDVVESWTFTRSVKAKDLNWFLYATEIPESDGESS